MPLALHYHPLSSYCHKVLIGLYELGVPFEGRLLSLGDAAERAAYLALWPTGKMPLLVDGERVVPESSIILEYLQTHHAKAATLLPADEQARLDVRLWDRLFDLYVMTPMQAIVADRLRPEGERDARTVASSKATLAMAYGLIEQRMAGRTWAGGEAFSLADCAAAPSLFFASTLVPFGAERPTLAAYFERLVARPSVARVLLEARPFLRFYPFAEAVPARFLEPAA